MHINVCIFWKGFLKGLECVYASMAQSTGKHFFLLGNKSTLLPLQATPGASQAGCSAPAYRTPTPGGGCGGEGRRGQRALRSARKFGATDGGHCRTAGREGPHPPPHQMVSSLMPVGVVFLPPKYCVHGRIVFCLHPTQFLFAHRPWREMG